MSTVAEHFMQLALAEGRKAVPLCEDNPPVGCLLVRNGAVVARGHTNVPGAPHAEAMALQLLGGDATDVTVYVTLEPCSFHGRTPSCAKALIKAGIRKVCVGMLDPDPRNNGRGIAMLRAAGIEVEVEVLATQVNAALQPYLGRAL
ncbi:MAG: bifunctional diaminohydroxyphosphoribosylaminopyrimidine deaminase/5-amino-6-(5-phosphoribosylamino)uracil reductase RibD [Gammaproteobacteria bacterium]